MASGIYAIINTLSLIRYVGRADNLEQRFKVHERELNKNKHCNVYLQNAWNKNEGKKNFIFEVIENCPIELLVEREKFYFDFYGMDKLYNISQHSNRPPYRAAVVPLCPICNNPNSIKPSGSYNLTCSSKECISKLHKTKRRKSAGTCPYCGDPLKARLYPDGRVRERYITCGKLVCRTEKLRRIKHQQKCRVDGTTKTYLLLHQDGSIVEKTEISMFEEIGVSTNKVLDLMHKTIPEYKGWTWGGYN